MNNEECNSDVTEDCIKEGAADKERDQKSAMGEGQFNPLENETKSGLLQ